MFTRNISTRLITSRFLFIAIAAAGILSLTAMTTAAAPFSMIDSITAALGLASAPANSCTSAASGSWGNPATWTGCGGTFPGPADDVTIASGNVVTLDTTRKANNLTINSGGTLDLLGSQFNLETTGTTFTNNGTLTNTGGLNAFYFIGNFTPGGIVQTLAGAGTYGSSVQVRSTNTGTVNVAASTSMTFNTALGNTNLMIDGGTTLDTSNTLTITAPSSGANYVGITLNGQISGAGGLKTNGNVSAASSSVAFSAPYEVVSGTQFANGTFGGLFKINAGTILKLSSTLRLDGDVNLLSGGTLDLFGSEVDFRTTGKTFTHNGTLINTQGLNNFYFQGNFTTGAGGITQNYVGAGTASGNAILRLISAVTVNVAASTSLTFNSAQGANNFMVDSGCVLDTTNALTINAPASGANYVGVSIGGSVIGAGGLKTNGNVSTVSSSSSFTAPFEVVSGTQMANSNSFSGLVKIDGGATLKLSGTLRLDGDLNILSGGTLDLAGSEIDFRADGKTFTNNGLLTNTGGLNNFFFQGNFTSGGINQTLAGSGSYGSAVIVRLLSAVNVSTGAGASLNNLLALTIDSGTTLTLPNTFGFAGPASGPTFAVISVGGVITGSTLQTSGNVQITTSGTFNVPLEVVGGITQSQGNINNSLTIDNGGMFKLTSTLNVSANLTINSGGTMDLNGSEADFKANLTTFTNNGSLTNTGGFNTFYFFGDFTAGSINQTFGGAGTYSGSVQVRSISGVTVNVAPSTSMTFNTAQGANNFQVDTNTVLNTTNALTVTAPASGLMNVGITLNGNISGAGGIKTNGNITTASSSTNSAPFEVVSGSQLGSGTFNGPFKIDGGATFKMNNTLALNGDLMIQPSATLDFAGSAMNFQGNNAVFTNNGAVVNTGNFNILTFVGNFTAGQIVQHFATSNGSFTDNLQERLSNAVTVVLDGDAQLGDVQIDSGSTLDITNRTLRLSHAGNALTVLGTIITPGSTIEMNGTAAQSVQTNLNGAAYNNLTINNPAGVDIPNPGANPMTVPGTLTLTNGVFTPNSNLTMGSGATIARSAGSLAAAPTFLGTINILYFGSNAITTGPEIPPSQTINNLTDNNTNVVTISSAIIVNGNATIASGATLAGSGLTFNGATFANNGTESVSTTTFGGTTQGVSGAGVWNGPIILETPTSSTTLLNDVTFSNAQFNVASGATMATGANTLTFNGGTFTNAGTVTGLVKTTGANVALTAGATGFNAALKVNAGTTTASGTINSTLTIDATAAGLQVVSPQTLTVTGNTTTNAQFYGTGIYKFNGATLTNNAVVSVAQVQFGGTAQTLNGTGSFNGNTATILTGSTTTLGVDKQMSAVAVNAGGAFNIANRSLLLSGGGNALASAGTFTNTGSTVEFNGTTNQAPAVTSYNNLTANNPGGVTAPSGTSSAGLTKVGAGTLALSSASLNNIQIDTGATLGGTPSSNVNVGGNFTNNSSTGFNANGNTMNFNGSGAQSIGGASPTTFSNLTIANSGSGVSLALNSNVNGFLTLTNDLNTGANTLTMPATGASVGAADVIGNVKRTGFMGGGAALSFGNPFNSIGFIAGGTLPTDVTINLVKAIPSGAMAFSNAIQRTYTMTPTGGSGFSATLRLHYLDGELNGNAEAGLKLWRFGASWTQQGATANDTTSNWAELSGVTQFSPWTLSSAEPTPTPSPTATFTPTATATTTSTPTNTPTSTPTGTATSTPTSTPTGTATSTPTNTPTPAAAISGTVTYGNVVGTPTPPRTVSGVLISGAGSPNVSTVTGFPGGTYSLTGFGAGSYTVTPSKTNGVTNITAFDAARIAQHALGVNFLTGNQLVVAEVSGNGIVTSYDAGLVARYVAMLGSPQGSTGTWIFSPVNRTYPSVTTAIPGQDYSALLMGEVSGDWTDSGARSVGSSSSSGSRGTGGPERSVAVSLPGLVTPADGEVLIPVNIERASDKGIISYELDLGYDPSVIQPQSDPVDIVGTLSSKLSSVANSETPGILRVVVYGPAPLDGNGVLVNLRFIAVGAPGSVSPLTWRSLLLNEGEPSATAADGQVELSAAPPNQAEIGGRVLTATGQGVANARVTLTDTTGKARSSLSNGFGVYRFGGLQVGQTYTISVESRHYAFPPSTVSVTGQLANVDMIAE